MSTAISVFGPLASIRSRQDDNNRVNSYMGTFDPPRNNVCAKKSFPMLQAAHSSANEKRESCETEVSSPEAPDHRKPLVPSENDLALAEFSSLESFEKNSRPVFDYSTDRSTIENPAHERFLAKEQLCAQGPGVFRRKKQLPSVNVAYVENGDDTMVPVNSHTHVSVPPGRELHEKAKVRHSRHSVSLVLQPPLSHLASHQTFFNQGDYKLALPLFEAILSARVRRFSPLHSSVGAAMHNVGVCRLSLGQTGLAENLFSEAVLIRRQVLGRDHFEVAESLAKLGTTQVALKMFHDARSSLQEALKITRAAFGYENKKVAQMLGHLGYFYFEAGELYASQSAFEEALDIYRRILSQERDRDAVMTLLIDTLCSIGSVLSRKKCFSKAIDKFEEALDLQRGVFGHDDVRILDNLGYCYCKNKEHVKAVSCYRIMVRAQISIHGTFTEDAYQSLRKQLLMYEKMNRISYAIGEAKEILQFQKSMFSMDHNLIVKTKQLLVGLTEKQRRFERKAYF